MIWSPFSSCYEARQKHESAASSHYLQPNQSLFSWPHEGSKFSKQQKRLMTGMILFRGRINTYEALDLSTLHLKELSVVHPMPSKIPVYYWSVKTTNHLSQTFRAKIFLWESFKTSITSSHKTIEKERRLKTYSLQQKGAKPEASVRKSQYQQYFPMGLTI